LQQPSLVFSLLNGTNPGNPSAILQQPSVVFSILNDSAASGMQSAMSNLDSSAPATSPTRAIGEAHSGSLRLQPFFVFSVLNGARPTLVRKVMPGRGFSDRSAASNEPQPSK